MKHFSDEEIGGVVLGLSIGIILAAITDTLIFSTAVGALSGVVLATLLKADTE